MASPTNDTYTVASGRAIYAGRLAAAFVPSPGQLKSVHLNTLSSVNPCPANNCWYSESAKQNGPWVNWCSYVFAPDYSALGAVIFWGGGHNGYDGTELYIFDFSTQMWSRLGLPVPFDFLGSIDSTWCDYLYNGDYILPAVHTYCHIVYLAPGLGGGGNKGSVCIMFNVYGPDANNTQGNYQPHAIDLETGRWTRLTSNTLNLAMPGGPYGGAFVDTTRHVAWGMAGYGHNQNVSIDLTQTTKTVVSVSSFFAPGAYFVPCYVSSKDMMIAACTINNTIDLSGYDLATGTPVGFTITVGSVPSVSNGGGMGFDWCADTGKFYGYEGFGSTVIHVLTPPSNWKTGTWTWSTETMTGETPVNILEVIPDAQGAQPFSKWKYNPLLKCFMWSQGTVSRNSPDGVSRAGAFQLYRPLGT